MIDNKERDALNFIRWLSAFAIVICHILQGYMNDYAFIFNIGVQVFFIMSGFLYGTKSITDTKAFYRGRIIKLYLPYIIWVATSFLLITSFTPSDIGISDLVFQALMLKNIAGLNHLWFMRTLFICYLFLPLFDRYWPKKAIIATALFVIVSCLVLTFCYRTSFLWIILYYIGYLLGRFRNLLPITLIISLFVLIPMLLSSPEIVSTFKADDINSAILHSLSGLIIYIGLLMTLSKINIPPKVSHMLTKWGGYEIYLTHHIFIIGPLSLLLLTDYKSLNIIIAIFLTVLSSIILHYGASWIENFIRYKK